MTTNESCRIGERRDGGKVFVSDSCFANAETVTERSRRDVEGEWVRARGVEEERMLWWRERKRKRKIATGFRRRFEVVSGFLIRQERKLQHILIHPTLHVSISLALQLFISPKNAQYVRVLRLDLTSP
jgi:hypothetical protein